MMASIVATSSPPGDQVTYTRRFFGDCWLEAFLMVVTLGVGWLVWFAFQAPKGQTPAKQILNVYIHDFRTGEIASTWQVWLREVVIKFGLPILLDIPFSLVFGSVHEYLGPGNFFLFASCIYLLSNSPRRALWDLMCGTVVRVHPQYFYTSPAMNSLAVDSPQSASTPSHRNGKRTSLIFLALALVGLCIAGGVGAASCVRETIDIEQSSRAYVDESVIAIVSSWNAAELIGRASPEFFQETPAEEVRQAYPHFAKQLGTLLYYDGATAGDMSVGWGEPDFAQYQAVATFERGMATIDLTLLRHEDKWQIAEMRIKSPALFK
jgi:uncharacterized RDD family membrane protein YckC